MTSQNQFQNGKSYYKNFADTLDDICAENKKVNSQVLRMVLELAIEIAREGREGRKIGTMFIIGDEKAVMESSRTLILDPLKGHPVSARRIEDPNVRESIKELAQLDGAFVLDNDGIFLSATRYIDAQSRDVNLPLGLGSRHLAAASITLHTDAVAIVVSESSVVRLIDDGEIRAEVIPELWLVQQARSFPGTSKKEPSEPSK